MKNENFNKITEWHQDLIENKGNHAKLKRCKSLEEIYMRPAYVELCRKLNESGDKVALIAGVLAHVKQPSNDKYFAEKMALRRNGDTPLISHIRFRRLMSIKSNQLRFRFLIRIVKQVSKGNAFNINQLAADLFYWSSSTKKNWAYQYYSTYSSND